MKQFQRKTNMSKSDRYTSGRCLARGGPDLSCLNGVADGQKEAAGFLLPATDRICVACAQQDVCVLAPFAF